MTFAAKLRAARLYAGLKQTDAAARSGVGQKTISAWETGSRLNSIKLLPLMMVLQVYGFSLMRFLAWRPEEPPQRRIAWRPSGYSVRNRRGQFARRSA